ncbi:MAG: hypothetical protein ACTSP6_11890 [Promethearchaeota archaeon]
MDFALMFNVLEGGVSEPIQWGKENLTNDRSVIILDESSLVVWLWHGVGRDIKTIKEIDERKIGRDPQTDELNSELQDLLNRKFKNLENFIVTFSISGVDAAVSKPKPKPAAKPKPEPKPAPMESKRVLPKPVVKPFDDKLPSSSKSGTTASEYDTIEPSTKREVAVGEKPLEEAKIAFIIKAVLDHYDDVWVSKKPDGTYAVEMLDGPVCQFSIIEGMIKFTTNSFSSVSPTIKTEINKKFSELSKLL